ncbi:MAG: type 11 methyltransferase [Paenibacillus sp.]|nr:type 11 methyltransferase [Paenibacillus sp.]
MYHWFIRPKWFTKKYIHDPIQKNFSFDNRTVLDFGSGTGANCSIFPPNNYLGIDTDVQRINYAKRLYPKYSFQLLEHSKLPVPDQSIDNILIVAVLHHVSSEEVWLYMDEFLRVLKPSGTIIVIEPYLCSQSPLCNWFMNWYDNGQHIRNEDDYLNLFKQKFQCNIIKRFRKCLLYNELFFFAKPLPQINQSAFKTELNSLVPPVPAHLEQIPFVQEAVEEQPQHAD